VHGDRDGDLDRLRGRRWDGVLDTCAYFPRAVREVAGLADALGSYALVSTLGVHPDDIPAGWNEETPTYQPPFPDTGEVETARRIAPRAADTPALITTLSRWTSTRHQHSRSTVSSPGHPNARW
jgi:hypothetical protein